MAKVTDPNSPLYVSEEMVGKLLMDQVSNRNLQERQAVPLLLANGLQAVGGRLNAAQAGKAAEALVATMARMTHPMARNSLAKALQVMSERLTTSDLLSLLQHPLVAEEARRALLDVLRHRTRREFRNTWHFLDWAHSNGVDLAPSRVPAALLAREN
jgi:hypothetical protein